MKVYLRKFTPQAHALIRKLSPVVKSRLRALTDALLKDPYQGKPLQRELKGFCFVKHIRYRVIYEIDDEKKIIVIHYVGLRENVYQLFQEFLKDR